MSTSPRRSFVAACRPAVLAFAVLVGEAACRRATDAGWSIPSRAIGLVGIVAMCIAFAGVLRVFVRYRARDRWLALAINLFSVAGVAAALVTVRIQR